jgi:hypothetical protein
MYEVDNVHSNLDFSSRNFVSENGIHITGRISRNELCGANFDI